MRLISFILMIGLTAVTLAAKPFDGLVVDSKQKPRKNVVVNVKGTNESVKTDKEGKFSIKVSPADTLVVCESHTKHAYLTPGEATSAKFVLNKKGCTITTEDDTLQVDYVKIKIPRRDPNVLTGEDIRRRGSHNLYDLLRGTIPGVNVIQTDTGQQILIRGISSLTLPTEPLFIINGVEVSSSAQADGVVVIEDIDRIEVNKSGAGYGVKGANGVILINTTNFKYESPMSNPKDD